MNAPLYHPAMRHAGPVRKALGIRTIFNSLGPLANPGGVRRQLVGISDGSRLQEVASILESLGHQRGMVVHGGGGADESTLAGPNRVQCLGSLETFDTAGVKLGLPAAPPPPFAGAPPAPLASGPPPARIARRAAKQRRVAGSRASQPFITTIRPTRSGASSAIWRAIRPPRAWPPTSARSIPASSRTCPLYASPSPRD